MTLRRGNDGRLYGTIEVLLVREVGGITETVIGFRAPFGPIAVAEFDGHRFLEEWDEFWESRGFTITAPPIWHEARERSRASSQI